MNLRQLEYLDAVGELGSFTAAARRLHVVQSAVSQQVRRLEAELGADLVTRSVPVRLTALGERVARRARAALVEIDAIRAEARDAGPVSGHLVIGTMHWLGPIDVPAIMASFTARNPDVSVTLVERTTPEMLKAVRLSQLDATFLSLLDDEYRPRGVTLMDLGSEDIVIAGSPEMLTAPGGLHLRFLHERPFIAFSEGLSLRATIDAALQRDDVQPRLVMQSNEPLTVRNLAARGLGYALLPLGVATAAGPPIATAAVHPPGLTRRLCLAWRSDRRPSATTQAFLAALRDHATP